MKTIPQLVTKFNSGVPEKTYGSFRDDTSPGDGLGSEANGASWDEYLQPFFAILERAGITPNGIGETVYTSQFADAIETLITNETDPLLRKSGGDMTGFLTLHADPTNPFHAATKQFVDAVATTINNHLAGGTNPHGTTKANVGLGNVHNSGGSSSVTSTSTTTYANSQAAKTAYDRSSFGTLSCSQLNLAAGNIRRISFGSGQGVNGVSINHGLSVTPTSVIVVANTTGLEDGSAQVCAGNPNSTSFQVFHIYTSTNFFWLAIY